TSNLIFLTQMPFLKRLAATLVKSLKNRTSPFRLKHWRC
ncbi:hypothetical protein D046_4778, partial [Vibrio parahaemolyticus V-223/04]